MVARWHDHLRLIDPGDLGGARPPGGEQEGWKLRGAKDHVAYHLGGLVGATALRLFRRDVHIRLVHVQASAVRTGRVAAVGSLNARDESWRSFEGLTERHALIGLRHDIVDTAHFKGQTFHRAGRRLPGNVTNGLRGMSLDVSLLFLHAKIEGPRTYPSKPCGHGIGFVHRGDARQYDRGLLEGLSEAHDGKGARLVRHKAPRLDSGAVWQDVVAAFHDDVAHSVPTVNSIKVVPLLDANIKTAPVEVSNSRDGRIGVVGCGYPHHDHRIGERTVEGNSLPRLICGYLANLHRENLRVRDREAHRNPLR